MHYLKGRRAGEKELIYTNRTKALLDYRADINVADFEGDTPLFKSILYYANNIMQLLLFRGVFYTTVYSLGRSILHVTAVASGLRTLKILLNARLRNVNTELVFQEAKTALQLI